MHPDFADWYRIVSPELKDIDLGSRWTILDGFCKKAAIEDFMEAARLFFGLSARDPSFLEKFKSLFKAADDKFPMTGNEPEVRILAGACLACALEGNDQRSTLAALLLKCASFADSRQSPVGDIVRLAKEYLVQASVGLRRAADDRGVNSGKLKAELEKSVAAVKKAFQEGANHQACAEPLAITLSSFSKAITMVADWAEYQESQQGMRLEESDVLWWLFAGHSRDLRVPFSDLPSVALCCIAAKELADITRAIPGPHSLRAFLAKVVREGHPMQPKKGGTPDRFSLSSSVEGCDAEWRRKTASRTDFSTIDDFCPAFVALRKCEEADGKASWRQVFKRIMNIDPTAQMEPVDLAEQAYHEWILARVISSFPRRK
jgi:hypothetical protein